MKKICIALVRFYQKHLSKLKGQPTCRFRPTCSAYAFEAIQKYGVIKGGRLALRRILRCRPFYKGDVYDPVP